MKLKLESFNIEVANYLISLASDGSLEEHQINRTISKFAKNLLQKFTGVNLVNITLPTINFKGFFIFWHFWEIIVVYNKSRVHIGVYRRS